MPADIDHNIVDGFPLPILNPVLGIPTYASIPGTNLKFKANAESIHSNLGNGTLGLLALTITPAVYNTISGVPFAIPVNTGATRSFQSHQQDRKSE
jgi:hypothetical protein